MPDDNSPGTHSRGAAGNYRSRDLTVGARHLAYGFEFSYFFISFGIFHLDPSGVLTVFFLAMINPLVTLRTAYEIFSIPFALGGGDIFVC